GEPHPSIRHLRYGRIELRDFLYREQVRVQELVFPATSEAEPLIVYGRFGIARKYRRPVNVLYDQSLGVTPGPVTLTTGVGVAGPESESESVKVATKVIWFAGPENRQFTGGSDPSPFVTGTVLSIATGRLCVPSTFPAPSIE